MCPQLPSLQKRGLERNNNMTELTSFEKEQALDEHNIKQQKLYKRGKIIVSIITLLQVWQAVLSLFTNGGVLGLIVNLALAAALFFGVRWVRYLIAAVNVIGIFTGLYTLLGGVIDYSAAEDISTVHVIVAGGILGILICIFISCTLLFSKAVSEFLYHQKYM